MKKVTHRVKTTMKMILVPVTTIFWVSMMNTLKIKIQSSFFFKFPTKKITVRLMGRETRYVMYHFIRSHQQLLNIKFTIWEGDC